MNAWRENRIKQLRDEGYGLHEAKKQAHLDEIENNLHNLDWDNPLATVMLSLISYLKGDYS